MKKIIYIILTISISSCESTSQNNDLFGDDVRLFENSPVWEFAKMIENNDTVLLKEKLKNQPYNILNYQEKKFGESLLYLSVYSRKLSAVKVLAELGADPNLKEYDSTTAVICAASNLESSEYLRILLKHGGNANEVANIDAPLHNRTPLVAASNRLESVKLLIANGADPNFVFKREKFGQQSVTSYALLFENIDVIKFLIVELGIDCKNAVDFTINGDSIYVVNELRKLTYKLGSEDHKKKMEVVRYLKTKGIDYDKAPIPKEYYQTYDKSYLKKY